MAKDGVEGGGERARGREGEREREMVPLVFIRANFLIFFLCAFWRLRLDPLQMQRGTGQRRNGEVPAARHASPSQRQRARTERTARHRLRLRDRQRLCGSGVHTHVVVHV